MAPAKEKTRQEDIKEKISLFFAKVGGLSKVQRLLICVLTIAVLGTAYYYFIFVPKNEVLIAVRAEHKSQVEKLETFKQKAKALKKYEAKMAQVQEKFDIAMKALPEKKELPSLLRGVSNAGTNAGLVFLLFQPEPVADKEFYKEIPLSMNVEGRYHQIADFFFQVAGLNRIVNIKDISMTSDKKEAGLIQMNCSAVTYMFAEAKEGNTSGETKKNKGKKKG
ncbi:MAG: protein PilO [Desulfobacula sp.]|nr:protein PilO [Desulfobacula sp.]